MKTRISQITVFLLVGMLVFSQAPLALGLTDAVEVADVSVASVPGYIDGEILISYSPSFNLEGLWQIATNIEQISTNLDGTVIALVKLKVGISVYAAIDVALREPGVLNAGLNRIYTIEPAPVYTMVTALTVARLVCFQSNNLSAQEFATYDMDKDGVLTMVDVLLIMRAASQY